MVSDRKQKAKRVNLMKRKLVMAKQDWSYQPKLAKLAFVSELPSDCISNRGRQTSPYMLDVIEGCKALNVGKGFLFVSFDETGENGIKPTQLVTLKNNLGNSFQVRAGTNNESKGVWVNRLKVDESNEERKARIAARKAKEASEQQTAQA